MIIALLATVISKADSFLMAGASPIVHDILKVRFKHADDKKLLSYSRLSVLLVSVFSLLLALDISQLVNLRVTGAAMLVSGLLAPITFGLFWKGTTRVASATGMWVGLIIAVIWQIAGYPFDIHPVFIGLPISALIVMVMSLFGVKMLNGIGRHPKLWRYCRYSG